MKHCWFPNRKLILILHILNADYLTWRIEERLELFRGRIGKMSVPNRIHQELSGNLHFRIKSFLLGKICKVYAAPFDVTLPIKKQKERQ